MSSKTELAKTTIASCGREIETKSNSIVKLLSNSVTFTRKSFFVCIRGKSDRIFSPYTKSHE